MNLLATLDAIERLGFAPTIGRICEETTEPGLVLPGKEGTRASRSMAGEYYCEVVQCGQRVLDEAKRFCDATRLGAVLKAVEWISTYCDGELGRVLVAKDSDPVQENEDDQILHASGIPEISVRFAVPKTATLAQVKEFGAKILTHVDEWHKALDPETPTVDISPPAPAEKEA